MNGRSLGGEKVPAYRRGVQKQKGTGRKKTCPLGAHQAWEKPEKNPTSNMKEKGHR